MVRQPQAFMELLSTSLPAQSTFFIQMVLVSTITTFIVEGLGLSRVGMGVLRSYIGPNLTARERKSIYNFLRPFSQPREMEHANHLAGMVRPGLL